MNDGEVLDALALQRSRIADYVEVCGDMFTAEGPDQVMTAEQMAQHIKLAMKMVANKIRGGEG